MKEKVILAYSGMAWIQQQLFHGLKRILIMKLSVSALIVDRVKNWTVWKKELSSVVHPNFTLRMLSMSSVMNM